MTRAAFIVLCLSLTALAGCNENTAIQKAVSPPLLLRQLVHRGSLSAYSPDSDIRQAIASLGPGRDIHAVINTANPRLSALTEAALIRSGVNAARIRHTSDPSMTFVLYAYTLVLPECGGALRRSWFGDVSGSMTALGTCTQARALGQELDNAGDLVDPAQLQPANGARFGQVVELWEKHQEKGSQQSSGSSSITGPGGGSGGSTGTPGSAALLGNTGQSAGVDGMTSLPPPPAASNE
ncbi:hypothetical protein J4P41_14605 [Gluconobacter sp. NFX36]|uniref:hypothetical protein n=1 Tax=Gluconobacter TaxID=441 RepID=UPI003CEC9FC8